MSPRALTVGLDGRFLQDKFHGIGRYLDGLVRGLSGMDGLDLVLFFDSSLANTRFPIDALGRSGRLRLQPCPIPLYSPSELWRWPPLARAARLDVFHSPYFWTPLVMPCPVVATVHDMIFDRFPQFVPGRGLGWVYRRASRLMLQRAAGVVTGSAASGDDILRYGRVAASKISVIPYGVDERFHPPPDRGDVSPVLTRHRVAAPYILVVGARRPHKNIRRLAEAFARLSGELPHTLVLVGGVDSRVPDDAEEVLANLRRTGRLRELGWVPEADLPDLYAGADLLVQPSIIEGFGLPVLEAMAAGCPVAAAASPGVSEAAGEAAEMFDPLDPESIARAIRAAVERGRAADLRRLGLARAATFNWRETALATLAVYRRLATADPA